ncbi:MAG: histidine--tRNA ligase, partial [Actinomyces oris]
APDSVKDIRSGEQVEADAATWQPPAEDAAPRITVSPAADCSPADGQDGCEVDSAS